MAHGPQHGARHGALHGPAHNTGISGGGMTGVSRDSSSNIYVPANSSEWATTMSAAGISSGGPSGLWLCQEGSGNLADSIGAFTLAAAGTGASYSNVVAGWSRVAIGTTEANATRWASSDAGLADPATTAYLVLTYATVLSAPAATRSLIEMGSASVARLEFTITPRLQGNFPAGASSTGSSDPTGSVRPYVIRRSFTGNGGNVYSNAEKVSPTVGASTSGKRFALGSIAQLAPTARILYAAYFAGSAADLTDAQIKTLLQTLGWSIAW
jgi:hypothetical protein